MTTYAIVPARTEHVAPLVCALRDADRREIWASGRHTPYEALTDGLRRSSLCWSGLVDGAPVCLFGVAPLTLLSGTGVPWMLGTDAIETHARAFLRRNRAMVAMMKAPYRRLENAVDARNTLSIRWLGWLGFTIDEPRPLGVDGEMFRRFWMEG